MTTLRIAATGQGQDDRHPALLVDLADPPLPDGDRLAEDAAGLLRDCWLQDSRLPFSALWLAVTAARSLLCRAANCRSLVELATGAGSLPALFSRFDDAPPGVGPLRRDRVRRETVHRGKRLLEGTLRSPRPAAPRSGQVVAGPLLLTERAQEEAGQDFLAQSAHGVLPLGDVLELAHQSEVARDDRFRRWRTSSSWLMAVDAEPDHQRDDDGEAEKNTVGDRDRHVRLQEQGKRTGKDAEGVRYREGKGFRRDRPISAAGLA